MINILVSMSHRTEWHVDLLGKTNIRLIKVVSIWTLEISVVYWTDKLIKKPAIIL